MASLKVNRGRTLARSQALQILLALQILFQSEMRKVSVEDVLAGDYTLSKGPLAPYAIEIARGVSANRDRIDSALRAVSANWTLERMPGADRNLLRAAVYELYFQVADTLDAAVVINEAVEIAKAYGTDESAGFVNGVLGRIVRDRNWTLERMPGADRNLLRAAVYELYFQVADTLDAAVVINEAVEIAKAYGTDESAGFVNGVLGRIVRDRHLPSLQHVACTITAEDAEAACLAALWFEIDPKLLAAEEEAARAAEEAKRLAAEEEAARAAEEARARFEADERRRPPAPPRRPVLVSRPTTTALPRTTSITSSTIPSTPRPASSAWPRATSTRSPSAWTRSSPRSAPRTRPSSAASTCSTRRLSSAPAPWTWSIRSSCPRARPICSMQSLRPRPNLSSLPSRPRPTPNRAGHKEGATWHAFVWMMN